MADSRAELRGAAIQRFRSVYCADEPTDWDAEEQRLDTVGFVAARDIATAAIAELRRVQDEFDHFRDNCEYSPLVQTACEAWDKAAAAEAERDRLAGELDTARDALTNARAVASDRIADRDKIAHDLIGERDDALAQLADARRTLDALGYRARGRVALAREKGDRIAERDAQDDVDLVAASRSSSLDTENSGEHEYRVICQRRGEEPQMYSPIKSGPLAQEAARLEADATNRDGIWGDVWIERRRAVGDWVRVEKSHLSVSENSGEAQHG